MYIHRIMGTLSVSEKFYSLQGEGQTMGVPAVFLRLSGCNLLCDGTWLCDTIEVWRKGTDTEFQDVLSLEDVKRLENGAHLVITGGEPLLHRKRLESYLTWFMTVYNYIPIIEVETNGTIEPKGLDRFVRYWNVSPKLRNSGEPFDKRFKLGVLSLLNSYKGTIFKFVITDRSDYEEIIQDFGEVIDFKKIILMPGGSSRKELDQTRQMVAELCIEVGHRYSSRLHINIWNQKTGV